MSHLTRQQGELLGALLSAAPPLDFNAFTGALQDPDGRGLKAYRTNGRMLAERALRAAYPAVDAALGDATFGALARAHWHAMPPVLGDVGRWGSQLPEFMEGSAALADTPWLADVARVEWALHVSAVAADVAAHPGSFAGLEQQDASHLWSTLAAGMQTVRSPWPLAQLLTRYLRSSVAVAASTFTPSTLTVTPQPHHAHGVVVWRLGWIAHWREASTAELVALELLMAGGNLAELAASCTDAALQTWMAQWVQEGILLGLTHNPSGATT